MTQRALVTGASGGIGLELAKLLAADGYDLTLVARSADRLRAVADDLHATFKITAQPVVADLSAPESINTIVAALPACDVLVNNAGFANNGLFATMDEREIRDEVQLDVVALTLLTRAYLPGMLERRAGRILNVASTAAFLPGPLMAVYYASKAYVLSFSEALAEEVRGTGVSVTCLCPGATRTGFQARANIESTPLMRMLPLADAASVARAGYRAMMNGKPVEIPGISNKLVALSPRFTPRRMLLAMSKKAVERN